jgi:hypothetical protein
MLATRPLTGRSGQVIKVTNVGMPGRTQEGRQIDLADGEFTGDRVHRPVVLSTE